MEQCPLVVLSHITLRPSKCSFTTAPFSGHILMLDASTGIRHHGLCVSVWSNNHKPHLKVYSVVLVLSTAVRASLPSEGSKDTCTLLTAAWRAAWTSQLSHTWDEDTLTNCSCSTRLGPTHTHTHIYTWTYGHRQQHLLTTALRNVLTGAYQSGGRLAGVFSVAAALDGEGGDVVEQARH